MMRSRVDDVTPGVAAGHPESLLGTRQRYLAFNSSSGASWFVRKDVMLKNVQANQDRTLWVDVEGETPEERRAILNALPWCVSIPSTVLDAVAQPTESDVIELQPSRAQYAHGVLSCAIDPLYGTVDEAASVDEENFSSEAFDAARGFVWCSVLITEALIVTMHDKRFLGLEEVVRALEMRVNLADTTGLGCSTITPSIVLATLVAYSSEMMLPDPTALLSEVDCIDEMVLLIAPGERDQPDLLRRVALLRRRISSFRGLLYLKEKLLRELVTPSMRGSFVAGDMLHVMPIYKEALDKNTQVAVRLDDARDILNQANLNFVTGVSMRMSQSSANMDFKMQILSQVAVICLPLNLLASIFGMNCEVPWLAETHPNLRAFWGIVGLMVGWVLLCSIPTIRHILHGNAAKPIVPADS
ncbi:putative CorA-like Mg2+ transporter protein [Leishmania shawi]|uniref:CorA-like Mg2+ transporter protein n=1 Tax=Leishmania shawi TaxID=5680 RepID=A0AAW3BRL0_9TRYP